MRIPGLKKATLAARWLRSRLGARGLILGYHRVADDPRDLYGLCVRPDVFESHLKTLRRRARPVDLACLVENLTSGRIETGSVHLTFDDGYAEVLDVVEPLLRQYEVPATVFVSTGSLGAELWWDRLERLLFGPIDVREVVRLCRTRSGRALADDVSIDDRAELTRTIYLDLLRIRAEAREQLLDEIEAVAGDAQEGAVSVRSLTTAELLELAGSEFVQVGSHTVSHPLLPELSVPDQRYEVEQSKVELEKILGRPVEAFSYPNGALSEVTAGVVRESGYLSACTSLNDVVRSGSDRFRLPRFWPGNWSARSFESWIDRWIG